MTVREIIKKVSQEFDLNEDEFLKESTLEFLLKKKSDIEANILEILGHHRAGTMQELEKIVQTDKEHPEWENLITLENLYNRLKEIQNDIEAVS